MPTLKPRTWLLGALFCGTAPLTVGVSTFLLWLPSHWDVLMPIGVLTIVAGTGLFPVGIFCMMRYVVRAKEDAPEDRIGRNAVIAAGILLLNFPAAGAIVVVANELRSRCTVSVDNLGDQAVESVHILTNGTLAEAGSIPPGGRSILKFRVPNDCTIRYRILRNGKVFEGIVEGYADVGTGGDWSLRVYKDGSVGVRDVRRPLSRERPGRED